MYNSRVAWVCLRLLPAACSSPAVKVSSFWHWASNSLWVYLPWPTDIWNNHSIRKVQAKIICCPSSLLVFWDNRMFRKVVSFWVWNTWVWEGLSLLHFWVRHMSWGMKSEPETTEELGEGLHRWRQQEQRAFADIGQPLNSRKQSCEGRAEQDGVRRGARARSCSLEGHY